MTHIEHVVPALEPVLHRPSNGKGFTVAAITLTPTDAGKILDHLSLLSSNDIDRNHVGMLADSMRAGEFAPGGQIHIWASDAAGIRLVYGHHQLHAAIIAGRTDTWCVTVHWNHKLSAHEMHRRMKVNQHPLTDADVGRAVFDGELSPEMQAIIIPAARYQNEWNTEYQLPEQCQVPPVCDNIARARERLEAFKQADVIINTPGILGRIKGRLTAPMVMAVIAETLVAEPHIAATFWKDVVAGGQGVAEDLRIMLIQGPPRGAGKHYWPHLVGQAWNDYIDELEASEQT